MCVVWTLMVAVLCLVASCNSFRCERSDADVLILGAGMAGLGAAETLSQNGVTDFLIIDQLDRIGGRVWTEDFGGAHVDLGPQWVLSTDLEADEDMQNPLLPLIQRCNISIRPIAGFPFISYNQDGEDITLPVLEALGRYIPAATNSEAHANVVESLASGEDMSVTQGLRIQGWNPRTVIEEHVEFAFFDVALGAPANLVSYTNLYDPQASMIRSTQFGSAQLNYVVNDPEGYAAFPQCIADEFLSPSDPRLILNTTITEVTWGDDCVCALSSAGDEFCAPHAIITFSIGVLQNGFVTFTPALPFVKARTLGQFDMSNFLKIFIEFNDTFWNTSTDSITYMDNRRSREYYPIFIPWGSYLEDQPPILEALLTGDEAKRVAYQDLETTREEIAEIMRNIYGERASEPIDIIMHDFIVNPYFYGDFSVSMIGVGEAEITEMNVPCGNMFFAGEAYNYLDRSTVHGALIHGRQTGERVAARIVGPLTVTFINDTPSVEGTSIMAQFRTNKPATTIECVIGPSSRINCSSGEVTYTDLANGTYQLRVIARIEGDEVERVVASRVLTVVNEGACATHFVNEGVSVLGRRASVEFTASGQEVSEFQCSLDGANPQTCTSPMVMRELTPGSHRLRVEPVCDGEQTRRVARIEIV